MCLMLRDDDPKFDLLDFNDDFFDVICYIAAENPREMVALLSALVVVCDDGLAFLSSLTVICDDSSVRREISQD